MVNFDAVRTKEAIAALAGMADVIWHEFFVTIITGEQIDYMVARFQSVPALTGQIANQGYEYYFLNAAGVNVGYLGIKAEAGKLFLSKIYLLKQYRGQGYASAVFAFLENICRARNLQSIWLTVNRHNGDSIAVYQKKGFRVIREQAADIGGGFVMDDYVMEKVVAAAKSG
jgi:ribosomal protein S18 acetylase RimI-like enzyme